MSQWSDTDENWVVACPGPGSSHHLRVPKAAKPSARGRLICGLCRLNFSREELMDLVRRRDRVIG
jgi:hypothetical protein